MKQKDIALIAIIIFISAIISIFVSKSVFVKPANRQQQVEIVQAITSDFSQPDSRYFNDKAFDPTKTITIGNNSNPDPFTKKKQ
jgi:hypothetical protein